MNRARRSFMQWCAAASAFLATGFTWLMEVLADALKRATPANIEGPYYRRGAPHLTKLNPAGDNGTPLVIAGRVTDTQGKALVGATVDVWQADPKGHYDNDDQRNPPPANKFRYRGVMQTDKEGRYSFETLVPGSYEIGGGQVRPEHIHYMVSAEGCKPVTTQLYFENDPFFEGDVAKNLKKDPFVKFRELVIPLEKDDKSKGLKGVFDVVLAKA